MPNERSAFADVENDDELPGEAEVQQQAAPPEPVEEVSEPEEQEEIREERQDERLARNEQHDEREERAEAERHKRTAKERRESRKRAQQLTREQNAFLFAQNQQLAQRLAALESGTIEGRVQVLDSDMEECSTRIAQAERILASAVQAQNGEDVVAAQRLREEARDKLRRLSDERERLANLPAQPQQQPHRAAPQPINPLEARFRAERPWLQFGPRGEALNVESGLARLIATRLDQEGYSDTDPQRWAELDRRLKAAIPDVEVTQDDEGEEEELPPRQVQRQDRSSRGPQVGRSGRASNTGRETVVPAEVVTALKEAGWWDDKKQRAEALKYFRESGAVK